MDHNCHCQTTRRSVALLYGGNNKDVSKLLELAKNLDWDHQEKLSLFTVQLGQSERFACLASLSEFLQEITPDLYPHLRVAWLDINKTIDEQVSVLLDAQLLITSAPRTASPLVNILENRRIETWFQPVFSHPTMQIWGYECLMRAVDDAGKIINPTQIIKWARQENLLFMLDRICRETHIKNAALVDVPLHCNFLINFLPSVIYDPNVCLTTTLAAAEKYGLHSKRVIFEVIETETIKDHDHLRGIIDYYRDYGFRIALDDLGAGHAGLTLLGDLSPDLIKIDRQLISKSVESTIHRTICESIVSIARQEKKMVLAEGVETHEEWQLFQSMGVDLYQGYLFGKPQKEIVEKPLVEVLNPELIDSSSQIKKIA